MLKLRKIRSLWPVALFALILLLPVGVFAADGGVVNTVVGWITSPVTTGVAYLVQALIELFGKLALLLIDGLIAVAGYNGYNTSPVIGTGWVLVRDVANLFFVAIILVISIGTIVNPGKFGGAAKVFRVLLFAIFVNFSRTIASLFIDISQIVMLTFVNGFAQAAGGNFAEALGMQSVMNIDKTSSGALNSLGTLSAIIMALIIFIIITVIIGVMLIALVVRMITLWCLVVISPLAFALGAWDKTKSHYDDWWKQFTAELTTGPVVAFFLWLTLLTIQSSTNSDITGQDLLKGRSPSSQISCGQTDFCQEQNILRFIIAACMLLQGLKFASQFSGVGGSLAKSATSLGKKWARGGLSRIGKGVRGGAWNATGGVRQGIGNTLAGGNRVGNFLNRIPLTRAVTSRVGMAFQVSANKTRAEQAKRGEEIASAANTDQLLGMSRGAGVNLSGQMAAKKILLGKPEKDTGWNNAKKLSEINALETHYEKTANKAGLEEIEKMRKKNPLLIDKNKTVDGKVNSKGLPLTKREQVVQKMSGADLLDLNVDSLNEIAEFLSPNQREHIKKNGGGEKERVISTWEAANPPDAAIFGEDLRAGRIRPDDVNEHNLAHPEIAVRLSADDLRGKVNDVLKTPAKRDSFRQGTKAALDAAPNDRVDSATGMYGADTQKAAEGFLRAGGTIDVAFRADATGNFNHMNASGTHMGAADEASFTKALEGNNFADVAFGIDESMLASTVNNAVKKAAAEALDAGKLKTMQQIAQHDADPKKMDIVNALAAARHDELMGRRGPGGVLSPKTTREIKTLEDKFNI